MNRFEIWTDGACSGNPGMGGWGIVIRHGAQERHLNGAAEDTTNNRMELTAAIKALEACPKGATINLYTDSDYLKQGITQWVQKWQQNGWRTANRKPVKNQDLWHNLITHAEAHNITWHWVKAHVGIENNEKADALARDAITKMRGD